MNVGYFSAYYRGLACLAKVWPSILEQVPDAKLQVAYGWESWLALEGANGQALYDEIEAFFAAYPDSVVHHGRLSHGELAKLMKQTKVLAYPTEFLEIFMITMTKALMAGMIPVTTGVGAIKETQGGFGYTIESANIYSNQYAQSKFVKAVVEALKREDYDPTEQIKFAESFDWSNVAAQWSGIIDEKAPPKQGKVHARR